MAACNIPGKTDLSDLHFESSQPGGPVILCVHGWGCDGSQFLPLQYKLEKHFRVIRLDLPGHGQTPLGDFVPSYETYACCVADFALTQGVQDPILLGHSMGGVLALMAACDSRLNPQAVINLDGGLPPAKQTLAGLATIRGWLDESGFRQKLAITLRQAFFLPHERDERCEAIIQTMCAAPEAVLRFLPEQITNLDAKGILPKLLCPVLFVGSAVPRFDAEESHSLIDNLRCELFPDTGHFLQIYATDKIAALIERFLS